MTSVMERASHTAPHIPVLLDPLLDLVSPVSGSWLDATFGAGGYAKGLIAAGADRVIGVDRDPQAHEMAASWIEDYPQLELYQGTFSELEQYGTELDGIVLDLGVSSMQLDQPERGFSFQHNGPLDMRMGQEGLCAAEILARSSESNLADILFHYGEERRARQIARAIVTARARAPITSTRQLAELVKQVFPSKKSGQAHPATRTFMALRIAVNDEYEELFRGLMAAERALRPGGILAVVTFHSIEDRMVKRFFHARAGRGGGTRHAPRAFVAAQFELLTPKALRPSAAELGQNPRSRSACLRVGRRTREAPGPPDAEALGMPRLPAWGP